MTKATAVLWSLKDNYRRGTKTLIKFEFIEDITKHNKTLILQYFQNIVMNATYEVTYRRQERMTGE